MTNLTNEVTTMNIDALEAMVEYDRTHPTVNMVALEAGRSGVYSGMSSLLVKKGAMPIDAFIIAGAVMDTIDELASNSTDRWFDLMDDIMESGTVTVEGDVHTCSADYLQLLEDAEIVAHEGHVYAGKNLIRLLDTVMKAYKPALAEEGVDRRFDYSKVNHSDLFIEFIHAMEETVFTVCPIMLPILNEVFTMIPAKHKAHAQRYMMAGCNALSSDQGYISEYKGDNRGRGYQAALHGPSGQTSDFSRSLYEYKGVSMDYNAVEARVTLVEEMKDMGSFTCKQQFIDDCKDAVDTPVTFILHHMDKAHNIDKAATFVKAALILAKLNAHIANGDEKPYIGMGFGKDAKCSGPQLGALMSNDTEVAMACGFSMVEIDDAYHNAIKLLEKAGFHGIARGDIKKPFMGIFYGQGWMAYMDAMAVKDETCNSVVWKAIHLGNEISEDRAKLFHKVVTNSFGKKMQRIRKLMKEYGVDFTNPEMPVAKSDKPTRHMMPDSFEVAMEYKVKMNVFGKTDGEMPDVMIQVGDFTMNLKRPSFSTEEYHIGDFARNGFVNMIQATDALVARLIVVKLHRLGAKHITSVHDCFRVSIGDMALLDEAIVWAYQELFGTDYNEGSEDLPLGTDILGMYFEGAEVALKPEYKGTVGNVSQFTKTKGMRRLYELGGVNVSDLIDALGTTYYFDK